MNGLDESMHAEERKTIEDGVHSTRALVVSFLQAVKSSRLYEANPSSIPRVVDRLTQDFDRFFEESDSFPLQITGSHLVYRGKAVYESQEGEENLASVFFKDGVREIRFYKGLEKREIADFLNVVRKSDRVNRMEDDSVTLFWEKDFSHIAITTADDVQEWGGEFVPATEEDLEKGVEYGAFEGAESSRTDDRVEPQRSAGSATENLRDAMNLPSDDLLVQACQLTSDETREINEEIEREQSPEYLRALTESLAEILLHLGDDREAYENMISYFEHNLESLLERREIGRAVTILGGLSGFDEAAALAERQRLTLRGIVQKMSGPRFMHLLGKNMRENGETSAESMLQYLRFLTKEAVDPLCGLLVETGPGKWKKVISDFLSDLCRDDIGPLLGFLSVGDPVLVCHVLTVLGKIGDPSSVTHLEELVDHDDRRVREMVLQILPRFEERGTVLIQKFLRDRDMEIRSKAALLLARRAKAEAVKPLAEIIFSEGFQKRGYEEKASFLRGLGETGAQEAIPVLKKIAHKRFWFRGVRWNEMRLCAAHTLKRMEAGNKDDATGVC